MSDCSEGDVLTQYKQQLIAVEESIKTSTAENLTELLDLKEKLTEVLILLGGSIPKSNSVTQSLNSPVDSTNSAEDEFLKFQQEISQLENNSNPKTGIEQGENSSDSEDESDVHHEFRSVLTSMEGNKCRAPFMRDWGEKNYHNALIFSTDSAQQDLSNPQDVSVKVMFCNPTCDQMKPCPFFLDGHCKFSDDKCRYSHGYDVKFADLEEYVLPNYSTVQRDSRCLAKYKDGLWHHAVIESCLSNNKYCIKYTASKNTETLDAHDILPLDDLTLSDDDSSSDSDSGEGFMYQPETANPSNGSTSSEINYKAVSSGSAIGDWEQHTKGIGSKLMAKMGYVWGQGLGKNSDGRLDPVEAIVLPKGKSLDKCAEIREYAGLESVEERFTAEQKKEERRAKSIESKETPESSVFAFLNKNISARDVNAGPESTKKRQALDTSGSSTNKAKPSDLNFELYSVGEAIKRTKKEIIKLRQSVNRNSDRNESTCSHMKQKMLVQTNLLSDLEAKERKISNEISRKKNHNKISVF